MPGLTQKSFLAIVVLSFAEYKLSVKSRAPSGKSPGTFFNIVLSVIATSKGEQFHHFACKIFIRMVLAVLVIVQKIDHGSAFANFFQQIAKIAQRIGADNVK